MPELSAHHVGLTVSDLDRAVDFYTNVLDLSVLTEFSVSGEAFSEAVGVDGAAADFAHLDADGARVELVEYDPAGADVRGGAVDDVGGKHLGLAVDDLEAFAAGLPEDVATLADGPRTTASGTTIMFVRDPDDNLVEILEA
jgi:catechol 2,3-dioxygenase-like lactoylglutathione lyase family enzyme